MWNWQQPLLSKEIYVLKYTGNIKSLILLLLYFQYIYYVNKPQNFISNLINFCKKSQVQLKTYCFCFSSVNHFWNNIRYLVLFFLLLKMFSSKMKYKAWITTFIFIHFSDELFDSGQEEGVSLRSVKKYGCNQRPLTCPPQMHQSTSSTLSSSSFGHHSLPRRQMTTSPSDQCSLCGFSIQVDRVSIKGVVYHKACFKCTR